MSQSPLNRRDFVRGAAAVGATAGIASKAFSNSNKMNPGRVIGANDKMVSNMGTARTNRANLYGDSAANYTTNASTSIANRGDAGAAGAIGVGNALTGGINAGFGIYGALGGQLPGATPSVQAPRPGTYPNPANSQRFGLW